MLPADNGGPAQSSEAAKDRGPEIDQAFADIKSKLTTARDLDWKDMGDHHGFWNQVGSAIKNAVTKPTFYIPVVGPTGSLVMGAFEAGAAKGAAEKFLKDLEAQMWKAYDETHAVWTDSLRSASGAPMKLAKLADRWEAQRNAVFTPTADQIKTLEQQDHWTGESADAYRQAIPSQRGAVHHFGTMIQQSSTLYTNTGEGMAGVYVATLSANESVSALLADTSVANPEDWGSRMRKAIGLLRGPSSSGDQPLKRQLERTITYLEALGKVAHVQQATLGTITDQAPPFAPGNGKWPEARGDTRAMGA